MLMLAGVDQKQVFGLGVWADWKLKYIGTIAQEI